MGLQYCEEKCGRHLKLCREIYFVVVCVLQAGNGGSNCLHLFNPATESDTKFCARVLFNIMMHGIPVTGRC